MRQGECNGCSMCCRFLILQVNPAYLQADRRHWIELHGIRLYERDGGVWAQINVPCIQLSEEGTCKVYGTDERPKTCDLYPFGQGDIDLVNDWAGEEVCSYSFV